MGAVAAGGDAGWAAGGSAERVAGELGSARAISTGLAGGGGGGLGGRPNVAGLAGGSLRGGVEKLAGGELFLGSGLAKDQAGGTAGKRKSPSGWHRRLSGQGGPASSCYNDITGSQGWHRSIGVSADRKSVV